ncbi:MAG TPA: hypothetical protein VK559_00040 [Ferruginibacter sp.]|nr:hypothetical protein [Ferruginibacter sp.]
MRIRFIVLAFCMGLSTLAFSQRGYVVRGNTDLPASPSSSKKERRSEDSAAKKFAPIQGKAIVYILRPSIYAYAVPMKLECDTFLVGWVAPKTYLYTILDSGTYLFKASSEDEFDMQLTLQPGKIYYLAEEAVMGVMYARTKLSLLTEEEGKKYLTKCMVSKSNTYPVFAREKSNGADNENNKADQENKIKGNTGTPVSFSKKERERELKDSAAKSLTPIQGKAIVYILRAGTYTVSMKLECDSFYVGKLTPATYLYTILDSGTYVFKATAQNEFDLQMTLQPGKVYYLNEEAKIGRGLTSAIPRLTILTEEEGKKYLTGCVISKSNTYPVFAREDDGMHDANNEIDP